MTEWQNELASEIDGVDRDIAHTVKDLSTRFIELARQAGNQSQRVEQVMGLVGAVETADGQSVQVADVINDMDGTLTNFAQEVVSLSKQAVMMVRTVDGILDKLGTLETLVTGIDRLTNKTNLLALNARIEAERAGEAGRSFNVVAGEVRDLSRATATLSNDIKQEIGAIAGALRGAYDDLATVASIDMSREIDAKDEVEHMLALLMERDRRLADLAHASMTGARSIEEAVAGIVVDMQFQDRVHQRLHHLGEGLRRGGLSPAGETSAPGDEVTLF